MKLPLRIFTALLLLMSTSYDAVSQSCQCHVTISKEGDYRAATLGIRPGQTICLKAGLYKYLTFRDLAGSVGAPIRIINCDGQVVVGTNTGLSGINFFNCKYVKLTGSGDSRYTYGIKLTQTAGTSGVVVTGFSTDFEIERQEISGTGFAGIMIKLDPTCDPSTWRGNFAMYNIKVHDNYIHDTGGEGIYIGNSFWNSGMVRTCNGVSQTVYPHNIYGLRIYNNTVERTDADGIQYACAPEAQVYNNTIRNTGVDPFERFQSNGIQASGGVSGRVYNNQIYNAPGVGITIIGHAGTSLLYNNLIVNTGESGMFCDDRPGTPANNNLIFTNNTIINAGTDGFLLYNEFDQNTLTNNAVIQPASGKLVNTLKGVRVTQQNNYYHSSWSGAQSARVISSSYKPLLNSPLVDRGMTNSYWGITTDLAGNPRPKGVAMDIGAYEFQPGSQSRLSAEEEGESDLLLANSEAGTELKAMSYPSPATDEVTIRLNDGSTISEVKLYSPQGAQLEHIVPKQSSSEIRLRTSALASGIYLFRVETVDSRWLSGRFVKE